MSSPAWEGTRPLLVVEKRVEAARVASLWLADAAGAPLPAFRPGQFLALEVQVPGRAPLLRCYSLSAPPGERYRITVKAQGEASAWLVEQAAPGARLPARAPAGRFLLDPGGGPVVLLAGGIGVTPLACMAAALAGQGMPREAWLIVGARDRSELALAGELEALAAAQPRLRLRVALSRPAPGDRCDHRGRLDAGLLARLLPASDAPYGFWLCGPPGFTADLTRGLLELGVPRSAIHEELFGRQTLRSLRASARLAPEVLPDVPGARAPVRFLRSGREATWTPAAGSLLDLAGQAGAPIPSACQAGRCGTCMTAVRSGEVRHLVQPAFEALRPGSCLPCVAVPAGPVELEA